MTALRGAHASSPHGRRASGLLLLGLSWLVPHYAQAQAPPSDTLAWTPGADAFIIAIPEADWSLELRVSELDSLEVINLPIADKGQRLSGALYGVRDTLRLTPSVPTTIRVLVQEADQHRILDWRFQQPPEASFSDAYIAERTGQYSIEIPEVYELVNIAFALTPLGRDSSNVLVWRHGPYYNEVLEHFGAFSEHPLIARLEQALQDDAYIGLRAKAYTYRFNGAEIVPSGTHRALAFEKELSDDVVPLYEQFAEDTGFRGFYAEHAAFYHDELAEAEALLPVRQMWTWLEQEFSSRSQSYRVVFSPLTYGTHNAVLLEDNGFTETLVLVAGPEVLADAFGSVVGEGTEAWRELELSRIVFTEFDHNYVNPAMGPLQVEISAAMADLDAWNVLPAYSSPSETFAEYMTWAVFLLYVDEHYSVASAAEVRQGVIQFMERNRGFVRFGVFMEALDALYTARAEGETLEALMPALIAWTAAQ